MKILYVHGFLGKPNGESSKIIKKIFNESEVYAPEIPFMDPDKSLNLIRKLAPEYDLIIASSLGAFYSMQQCGTYKILINPAMPDDLLNLNWSLPNEYINLLRDQFFKFQDNLDFEQKNETYVVFGKNDDIANNQELFNKLYYHNHIKYLEIKHKLEYTEEVENTLKELVNEINQEIENDRLKS